MRYCPYCQRLVSPIKRKTGCLVTILYIILFVFTFPLSLLYLIVCGLFSGLGKVYCPICGGKTQKMSKMPNELS